MTGLSTCAVQWAIQECWLRITYVLTEEEIDRHKQSFYLGWATRGELLVAA